MFSAAPELLNPLPFACEPAVMADESGRSLLVPIVKATLDLLPDGRLMLAQEQRPVVFGGSFWSAEPDSSYRDEPDCAFFKPATDVVLHGHARARSSHTREMMVGIKVGPVGKVATVLGDRWWRRSWTGKPELSPPQAFETLPLTYEHAFGGWDRHHPDPARHACEPRNPSGTGFVLAWPPDADTVKAPNIEDARRRMSSVHDRPSPAGFGYTAAHWQPRARWAGTYDERWATERKPLLPADFDRRYFNAASPGLVAPGYLRGDEEVVLLGVTARERWAFQLPAIAPPEVSVSWRTGGQLKIDTVLDTVLVDTDRMQVVLSWRGHLAVADVASDVSAIALACTWPRALAR